MCGCESTYQFIGKRIKNSMKYRCCKMKKKNQNKPLEKSEHIALYKFIHNKTALISIIILLFLVAVSVFAPVIATYDFDATDLMNVRKAPGGLHILGTDSVGRDVFTRVLYGGRVSILVGISSMLIQLFMGTLLGTTAGYYGGIIDMCFSRIADAIMCFPFFVIAMSVVAVIGPGTFKLVFVIGFLMWPRLFRIVRTEVMEIKENDYIAAAVAMGLSSKEIIVKHLLPNVISPVLVSSTLSVAQGIILEASLSFLGLGVQPPLASWGNMLSDAQSMSVLANNWWMWVPPGLMVALTVLAINFVGEGLRDALDPKAR